MNINSIRMKDKLIKDAWAVLLEEIQIANPALPPLLNRGLPRNFVESEIQKFSVLLPEDLYHLYETSNGYNEELISEYGVGQISFFPDGMFNSFQIGVQVYKSRPPEDPFWKKGMFPVCDGFLGEYCLLNCEKESETYNMVSLYSPALPDHGCVVSKYDSLWHMLHTTAVCFQRGAYFYARREDVGIDDSLYFETNRELEFKIAASLNLNSDFWKVFVP